MDSVRVHTISIATDGITEASTPLAYWTGYTNIVLVSSTYIRPWSVSLLGAEGPRAMVFPRRWLDVAGRRINDVWEAALRAVIGVILLRPGVAQVCDYSDSM